MSRLSGSSIRRQLIVPLLSLSFLVIAGISGLSAWLQSSHTAALLEQHQQQVATVLQQAAFPLTGSVLQQTARLADQQIVIWDPGAGRVVDSSFQTLPADLQSALAGLPREHWLLDDTGEAPANPLEWIWQSRAGQFQCRWVPSRWRPQFRIVMLASASELEAVRWRAIWPPLAIGAAAMAAIIPWLLALTARWSHRLQQIQRRVSEIAQGQLQPGHASPASLPQTPDYPTAAAHAGAALAPASSSADELTVLVEDVRLLVQGWPSFSSSCCWPNADAGSLNWPPASPISSAMDWPEFSWHSRSTRLAANPAPQIAHSPSCSNNCDYWNPKSAVCCPWEAEPMAYALSLN